jgi:hypothetical protein
LDFSKIPVRVLDAVRELEYPDEEIVKMSHERLFELFCNWEGLIGYGPMLYRTVVALESTK